MVGTITAEEVLDEQNPFQNLISGAGWLVRAGVNHVEASARDGHLDVLLDDDDDVEGEEGGGSGSSSSSSAGVREGGALDDLLVAKLARTAIGHDSEGRLILLQVCGRAGGTGGGDLAGAGHTGPLRLCLWGGSGRGRVHGAPSCVPHGRGSLAGDGHAGPPHVFLMRGVWQGNGTRGPSLVPYGGGSSGGRVHGIPSVVLYGVVSNVFGRSTYATRDAEALSVCAFHLRPFGGNCELFSVYFSLFARESAITRRVLIFSYNTTTPPPF